MSKGYLCLRCRNVAEPGDDLKCCPSCGGTGVPADLEKSVTVNITVHELRVLVIWAERWATAKDDAEHETMRRVLYGIAGALQIQIPDGTALTFSGELADLRSRGLSVEQNVIKEPRS